jgi:hypothetical protein
MSDRSKAWSRPGFIRRSELIIAEKEFRDHVTSKRFIIVFGILLLLAVYSLNAGMNNYNQKLGTYKNDRPDPVQSYTQYQIDDLHKEYRKPRKTASRPKAWRVCKSSSTY